VPTEDLLDDVGRFDEDVSADFSTAPFAAELARRWAHGDALLVVRDDGVKRRLSLPRGVRCASLAEAADGNAKGLRRHQLVVVADAAGAVTEVQSLVAKLPAEECTVVLLNPRLTTTHPFSRAKSLTPMLLSDFTTVYVAEADALERDDDTSLSVYMRWPLPSYRLFERRREHGADHFAFLGSVPHRPSQAQLLAVHDAATHALESDRRRWE